MADRDYVLGIGIELNNASAAEFENAVRKRLEQLPPMKIKVMADDSLLTKATEDATLYSTAVSKAAMSSKELSAAIKDLDSAQSSYQIGLEKVAIAQNKTVVSAKEVAQTRLTNEKKANAQTETDLKASLNNQLSARKQYEESVTAIISKMQAEQTEIVEKAVAQRAAALKTAVLTPTLPNGTQAGLVSGPDGKVLEEQAKANNKALSEQNAILKENLPALQENLKATTAVGRAQFVAGENARWFTQGLTNIKNVIAWGASSALVFGAATEAIKGMTDALHAQQEQVIQGFYYSAQGKQFSPMASAETQQAAIDLARKYGEDVVQVQEAIGLWAKSTNGELVPSIQMANEALKMNAVTGMNNEEIYRSTIAVLSQYHQSLEKTHNLWEMSLGLATRYGGGIKALGGESQDAARQMLEGMDSSAAVFAKFGLSVETAAGAVAALIQIGNKSGSDIGGGLSRALAALDRKGPEKALTDMGIQLHDNLDLLDDLKKKKNDIVANSGGKSLEEVLIGSVSSSAREPLQMLLDNIPEIEKAIDQAKAFEKSDPLGAMFSKIQDTDQFKLNQIKASLESMTIVIGKELLPVIGQFTNMIQAAVPTLLKWAPAIAEVVKDVATVAGVKLFMQLLLSLSSGMQSALVNVISAWESLVYPKPSPSLNRA
jgi:TP901 family phage tail tape measure protein